MDAQVFAGHHELFAGIEGNFQRSGFLVQDYVGGLRDDRHATDFTGARPAPA
jgi:hypothetical protein